ncbi:NADH-quinone oxidoreductase subunit NuoE [Pelagivirga sediminicola]|uniref:NADH-quinone oxidoreductase subunit NuoE n=1 Tax=Pelagivirga sediminicola TaxID=2170575 RepID=A0A2T7GBT6_9RHOB|nr:NADH-quinone oxidoreductase subunit NuoE [Pelagivirga sediminicola]PVA11873.1 NADH-quinone oxidoreductase subunit NuoE [Pelagivirga sediminicola]
MLRRLHPEQPDSFAFTPENQAWAEAQIAKFPEGRQASAIIPLMWRAHEQEGWLTRPAIEGIADMLDMAYMRALEVASFYFQFQLQPTGSIANIQICGTTSCMICGAEDLIGVCREKIADAPHTLSADGKFSWEEVECQGACANAPMAMIGKDYYEDLTAERLREIIDELAAGGVPVPGPQNGRFASEPKSGLTSLKEFDSGHRKYNASVQLATDLGETVKRIDGTEVPLLAPWREHGANHQPDPSKVVVRDAPLDIVTETDRIDPAKAAQGDAATSKAKPRQDNTKGPAGEPGPKDPKSVAKTSGATAKAPQMEEDPSGTPDGDSRPAKTAANGAPVARGAAGKTPLPGTADKSAGKPDEGAAGPGAKPATLKAARAGGPDDLKMIKGVGPKLESLLNDMGFYHFDQIAAWSPDEVAWVDQNIIGFKGRVTRDDWVRQAGVLASGGETEFAKRVKKGDVYE